MWKEIFNLAINNGLWAVLFLALLVYQLRDSRNREIKYQKTIENLGKSFEMLKEVKDDVVEIKESLEHTGIMCKHKGCDVDEKAS